MNKVELYNVPSNKTASTKQIYAVANHFAKITDPSKAWQLKKVYGAIMLKYNAENSKTPITHGDINIYFSVKEVPAKFLDKIKVSKNVKAVKPSTPAKAVKPSAPVKAVKPSTPAKAVKPSTPTKAVKPSDESLKQFTDRLAKLSEKQDKTDKRVSLLESKIDILMAFLETDPDA
jgi:uncharacterized Zn finger protein (UPF0148 family)